MGAIFQTELRNAQNVPLELSWEPFSSQGPKKVGSLVKDSLVKDSLVKGSLVKDSLVRTALSRTAL